MATVPFEAEAVKAYLDLGIANWRAKRNAAANVEDEATRQQAICYIDAYQSVRMSLFGELLPDDVETLAEEWTDVSGEPQPPENNGVIGDPNR